MAESWFCAPQFMGEGWPIAGGFTTLSLSRWRFAWVANYPRFSHSFLLCDGHDCRVQTPHIVLMWPGQAGQFAV